MPGGGGTERDAAAATVDSGIVRDLNTSRLLGVLRDHGPLTRPDLVRRTGLTRPTVAAIVRTLRDRGVVIEVGADRRAHGRPATLLSFQPCWTTVAVCRVMGPVLEVVLADTDGTELGRLRRAHRGGVDAGLTTLAAMVTSVAEERRVPRPTAAAVLLGARIDPSTGAGIAAAFGGGSPVTVATLTARLGLTVVVLNPAAAAALGVARTETHRDAVVVFLDHGIGVGMVSAGRVLAGAGGGTGELGHCQLPGRTQEVCRCGQVGCLETVAAGWSIRERIAAIRGPDQDHLALVELEALGDARVDEVLQDAARHLGWAVSWVVNLLNPTAVLLGGSSFAVGADRFLATFAAAVVEHAVVDNGRGLGIGFASDRADVEGGLRAALDLLPFQATVAGLVPAPPVG